jgi:hypothetical protein
MFKKLGELFTQTLGVFGTIALIGLLALVALFAWRVGWFQPVPISQRRVQEQRAAELSAVWHEIVIVLSYTLAAALVIIVIIGLVVLWRLAGKTRHVRQRGGLFPVLNEWSIAWVRNPGDVMGHPELVRHIVDPNRSPSPVMTLTATGTGFDFPTNMTPEQQVQLISAVLNVQQAAAWEQGGGPSLINVEGDEGIIPPQLPSGLTDVPIAETLNADEIARILKESGLST